MFGKKRPSEPQPPNQSQSLNNLTVNGGMVQLGQAGGDLQQNQTGNLATQQQGISSADVVSLLERLETAIKEAGLTASQQEELLDYLRPAKREAAKETPNKDLVGQNLKQVSETLKTVQETTEAGKSLWQTAQEVLTTLTPWLGVVKGFFGF